MYNMYFICTYVYILYIFKSMDFIDKNQFFNLSQADYWVSAFSKFLLDREVKSTFLRICFFTVKKYSQ